MLRTCHVVIEIKWNEEAASENSTQPESVWHIMRNRNVLRVRILFRTDVRRKLVPGDWAELSEHKFVEFCLGPYGAPSILYGA